MHAYGVHGVLGAWVAWHLNVMRRSDVCIALEFDVLEMNGPCVSNRVNCGLGRCGGHFHVIGIFPCCKDRVIDDIAESPMKYQHYV